MRILLFCPTNRLEKETALSIHTLQYDGALDVMFTRDNPHGESAHLNIIHNYKKAERIVMAEGYDALFTVENDMIIPPDALTKLAALQADIAYGVYYFRHGKPTINILRHDDTQESYSLPSNLKAWAKVYNTGPLPCRGLGFGCTLISRKTLEAIPFHSDNGGDADSQMSIDARRIGLKQMTDTTVLCGHKRPDGTVVWPAKNGFREVGIREPVKMRLVRALQAIAYWTPEDVPVIFQMGDVKPMDFETAGTYVSCGMVEYAD